MLAFWTLLYETGLEVGAASAQKRGGVGVCRRAARAELQGQPMRVSGNPQTGTHGALSVNVARLPMREQGGVRVTTVLIPEPSSADPSTQLRLRSCRKLAARVLTT